MAIRALPDLSNEAAMAKLGRLSALRSARLDAVHELRDCYTQMQSDLADYLPTIQRARGCLDRLEELANLERQQ